MGRADLWRHYSGAQRSHHRKARRAFLKQENEQHCIEMVRGLSECTHRVYTANIVVFNASPPIRQEWVSRAEVTFGRVAPEIIA